MGLNMDFLSWMSALVLLLVMYLHVQSALYNVLL